MCLLDYLLNSSRTWIYNPGLIRNGTSSTGPAVVLVLTLSLRTMWAMPSGYNFLVLWAWVTKAGRNREWVHPCILLPCISALGKLYESYSNQFDQHLFEKYKRKYILWRSHWSNTPKVVGSKAEPLPPASVVHLGKLWHLWEPHTLCEAGTWSEYPCKVLVLLLQRHYILIY